MSGLRITGGTLRGRRIPVPQHDVRPTSGRARQAFFDIIGDAVHGCGFLDLFAGSGIFSFEAVSRGAARAVAVDESPRAMRAVALRALEWKVPVETVVSDVPSAIEALSPEQPFGVVFADPPYRYSRYGELLRLLDGQAPLQDEALVGIEHESGSVPFLIGETTRLEFRKTVSYGNVAITIFDGG
ncbi:MAG TPA: RsmD family RNA methyltransferase [Thermoanaerobaculia bacterium]|nr:RsmD family RNA methyltransferase [Thermoanaerobaculia bacterium]